MVDSATKHDDGKPQLHRYLHDLPLDVMNQWLEVLDFGAVKYDRNNWKKGMQYSRLYDAALRHMSAFWEGEEMDPETKLPHLAHAMCNIGFLMWYRIWRKEFSNAEDDRPGVYQDK